MTIEGQYISIKSSESSLEEIIGENSEQKNSDLLHRLYDAMTGEISRLSSSEILRIKQAIALLNKKTRDIGAN